MKWPPLGPYECCEEFKGRRDNPRSGPEVPQTQWKDSSAASCTDEGTYQFARELAKAGIFVNIVYGTERHKRVINANAGLGSIGQSVIYTKGGGGTIIWTNTGRVCSPNGDPELQAQLRVIFEPFDAQDVAKTSFGIDAEEESGTETVASLDFDVA